MVSYKNLSICYGQKNILLGHPYNRNITWTPLWSEYYMAHIIWDTTVKGDLTVNYGQILTLESDFGIELSYLMHIYGFIS